MFIGKWSSHKLEEVDKNRENLTQGNLTQFEVQVLGWLFLEQPIYCRSIGWEPEEEVKTGP